MSAMKWLAVIVIGGSVGGFATAGMMSDVMKPWTEQDHAVHRDVYASDGEDSDNAPRYASPSEDEDGYAEGESAMPTWLAPPPDPNHHSFGLSSSFFDDEDDAQGESPAEGQHLAPPPANDVATGDQGRPRPAGNPANGTSGRGAADSAERASAAASDVLDALNAPS